MNKVLLSLLFIFLSVYSLRAQINESDTAQIQLQLRSGGSFQTGNVELIRIASQFDFSSWISPAFVFKTQNNHLYQEIFDNKADDDLTSRNYLYYKPLNKVYPYAIGYISTNFRRNIDLRAFYGLGLTYQLLQKQAHNIKLSSNLLYEKSTFTDRNFNFIEFNGNNQIKSYWNTVYLSGFHEFNENSLKLNYEVYWQQSLEKRVNYRYHMVFGLDQKLIKSFSLQTRIIYAFENVTNSRVKQNDLLWIWGLSYIFKSNKQPEKY
ncbi:DUF481 domain-containing protein [Pararhodonellum marinum]|uniref:DUF481 domain-containing protein n=1 Tax=Pararhodonellum marinum TaxID=2755358 RepID=UPI00188E6320|nr:DUF481 domain-containing protein [Pararhodonellum marinum]